MNYFVRVYCHTSFETGSCSHHPVHPFVLPEPFESILAANDRGEIAAGSSQHEEVEWEVIDDRGKVVC